MLFQDEVEENLLAFCIGVQNFWSLKTDSGIMLVL